MIHVTCAIIVNSQKQVLVTQRSSAMQLPLKWELPGGKIEPNETPEACLIREIKEELDISIKIDQSLVPNDHNYDNQVIRLIPFTCTWVSGEIQLKEHADYRWLHPKDLLDLNWAEADIPVVRNYLNQLNAI